MMGGICKGTDAEISANLDEYDEITMSIVLGLVSIQAIITVVPTVYIFLKRERKEVSLFVWVQVISLNIFWACFLTYYILLVKQTDLLRSERHRVRDNMIATFAELAYIIHAWAMTEPIYTASLMLPIATNLIRD